MSVIFYFSGSGNSLDAARQTAAVLPSCRLEPMSDYLRQPYEVQDEIVGFACPVHCFDLPPLVQRFLKAFSGRPQYTFALVTMGGNQGRSLRHLQQLLSERQISLSYATAIVMPDNFFLVEREKANRMLAAADKALAKIADDIHARRQDTSRCLEHYVWKWLGIPLGWWFMRDVLRVGRPNLMRGKCSGCGSCARLCPTKNITMENGRPLFGKDCTACFACRHWCPEHAVKMGGLKSKAHESYTNPNIKIQDMFRKEGK